MNYYCPQCHAVIYDRTSEHCAVCGAHLTENSFLTAAEIECLHGERAEVEERRKRDSFRQEVEEQQRRDQEQSFSGG